MRTVYRSGVLKRELRGKLLICCDLYDELWVESERLRSQIQAATRSHLKLSHLSDIHITSVQFSFIYVYSIKTQQAFASRRLVRTSGPKANGKHLIMKTRSFGEGFIEEQLQLPADLLIPLSIYKMRRTEGNEKKWVCCASRPEGECLGCGPGPQIQINYLQL